MNCDFEKLLGKKFNGNDPATPEEIAAAERSLGKSLPDDYREFLLFANGGEGFIGENYAILWGAGELGHSNEAYQADKFVPGLLLFGSDGGGEAYAFDVRTLPSPVVMVPFIVMSFEDAWFMAPTFTAFLEKLRC